eukprot:833125-Rhodomonas_salina.1
MSRDTGDSLSQRWCQRRSMSPGSTLTFAALCPGKSPIPNASPHRLEKLLEVQHLGGATLPKALKPCRKRQHGRQTQANSMQKLPWSFSGGRADCPG